MITTEVAAFREFLPDVDIFYALKANGEPAVLAAISEEGCGFEAASQHEIELLLHAGVHPGRIIYGTAVKPRSHIAFARNVGIDHYAADSIEELDKLAGIAPGSQVFVRAKVDDSASVFHLSEKFGAPLDRVAGLVRHAVAVGLVPWGISFNVGSQSTDGSAWARAIDVVRPVIEDLLADGIKLNALNLGGGFPTVYDNHPGAPTLREVGEAVAEQLGSLPYVPQIIVEPGRALVSTSTSFVTSVIARVERDDATWLFLDGGIYNGLFEAMTFQGETLYPVRRLDSTGQEPTRAFRLAGPTGDSLDVLRHDVQLPAQTGEGDRIVFANAGAYTIAMTCTFNGFPKPALYMADDRTDR